MSERADLITSFMLPSRSGSVRMIFSKVTYRDLALALGQPHGAQAVGGAVGRNPVSIIVPCHRVLGSDGGLTGYMWGVHVKRWLLDRERRVAGRTLF
jgi:methylated-DNA-[protein]-cysteine S-methyltransferase